jgi:hypothetical protein
MDPMATRLEPLMAILEPTRPSSPAYQLFLRTLAPEVTELER